MKITDTYQHFGITLSPELIQEQIIYMQGLIFTQCSSLDGGIYKCAPCAEVLEIMFKHIPLNEALEPEVLSTIILDIAEELALLILELANEDLDPRLVGLFAYDFVFQSLQSLFEVEIFDEGGEVQKSPSDKPYDTNDPMFV